MICFLCYLFFLIFIYAGCQEKQKIQVREFSKIVFLSNREASEGRFHIFKMNPDGSDPINLTPNLNSLNSLSRPLISPDGRNVLFTLVTDKRRLQLLNIENRKISTVMDLKSLDDVQYSFSPKSDKITFVLKISDIRQVYVINTDGSNKHNISNPEYNEFHPSFSHDGSRIVYVSKQKGHHILTTIKADGSDRKDLLEHKSEIMYPGLSPDGESIAFIAYEKGKSGLYTVPSDGGDKRLVTRNSILAARPQFTPDGLKIVYLTRDRGIKFIDISIIDIDGIRFKNLTRGLNIFNHHPQIIPNGKSIVFQSSKFKEADIYSVGIDGKNLINLTNHPKLDQTPSL